MHKLIHIEKEKWKVEWVAGGFVFISNARNWASDKCESITWRNEPFDQLYWDDNTTSPPSVHSFICDLNQSQTLVRVHYCVTEFIPFCFFLSLSQWHPLFMNAVLYTFQRKLYLLFFFVIWDFCNNSKRWSFYWKRISIFSSIRNDLLFFRCCVKSWQSNILKFKFFSLLDIQR